jgi:hypothetical protein
MAELQPIAKTERNQQQGFMYRGIDSVMNALQPLFVKHKVYVVPEMQEHTREERQTKTGGNLIYSICKMKYTFYTDDGSNISAVVIGEGMDSGDKATNKAMAIAMKYACFQVFCIPTEEMKDPDGESHELKGKEPKPEPKPEQKQEQRQPSNKATKQQCTELYKYATVEKGWTKEQYQQFIDDLYENKKISSKYSKKYGTDEIIWTVDDVTTIRTEIDLLPF